MYLLILFLAFSMYGKNMFMTHGFNYSYSSYGSYGVEQTIFPIAWDVRSANNLILAWQDIYDVSTPNPVTAILAEAKESGFNAALLRSELTDKQFPLQPGDPGDEFFVMASTVRNIGLNLIVGGLKTALDEDAHNQKVLDYLTLYIPQTAGNYPGEVIGSFAFDEPDVKYLVDPDHSDDWLQFVSYWNNLLRQELSLPVLSYHAKYGTPNSFGYVDYYTDTTSVLNRMARFTDVVGMDMYPVKNSSRRKGLLSTDCYSSVFTVTTDMIQNDLVQIQATNSRDELIRVFPQGDSALVEVQNILWNGLEFYLETVWSFPIDFMPDFVDASDFRSGFAIQESPSYVNSAVVLWKSEQLLEEAVVIVSHEGGPVVSGFPDFPSSDTMKPSVIVVGQTDYWSDILQVNGIIGHGRLAILTVLQNETGESFIMLFTAGDNGSEELVSVFNDPVQIPINPTSAVWGTFWGTWYEQLDKGSTRTAHSGFILYDTQCNYITVNQTDREVWSIHPDGGTNFYSSLFETQELPDFVRISRVDSNSPSFFAGIDHLVGWYGNTETLVAQRSDIPGNAMRPADIVQVQGLPTQDVTGFDFVRNDIRYFDSFLFTVTGGDVYSSTSSIETGYSSGSVQVELNAYSYGDTVLTAARVQHTRDSYRSPVLPHEDGFYIPYSLLCFDRVDRWRFQWYPEAFQVAMDLGISQTERDNSMFAVVQSYGRHAFALPSYCASPDTMLYITTAPIVEGARGLVFYALDISMMSGNGGDDGLSRAPFILQNWGPSKDTANTDMVGIVHGAVARLTGNTGGTNYLDILVDSNWTVLSEELADNSLPSDTLLNFIALQNASGDSIVVITVNESTESAVFNSSLFFADIPFNYNISSSQGYLPVLQHSASDNTAELDFSGMPTLTASLVTMTTNNSSQEEAGWFLNTSTYSTGLSAVTFSVPINQEAQLSLFDLSGRKVTTLWSGTGLGSSVSFNITRGSMPVGLYFVTLSSAQLTLSGKCFLW